MLKLWNCELSNLEHTIPSKYIIQQFSNSSIINISWLVAQGSWLTAKKNWHWVPQAWALAPNFSWPYAMSLEPRALRREPWAWDHEPVTNSNRIITELFGVSKDQRPQLLQISPTSEASIFHSLRVPNFLRDVPNLPDFWDFWILNEIFHALGFL